MNAITHIELGRHKVEVCISSNGERMIKHSDVKELLDLEENVSDCFIDAGFVTDTLFNKIYITKDATKEQEIIHRGLCIVGIYSVIDEVCAVDLKNISYVKEFRKYFDSAFMQFQPIDAKAEKIFTSEYADINFEELREQGKDVYVILPSGKF